MSMNIYAKQGTKVKALFDEQGNIMHGTDSDQQLAGFHLLPNKIYTVDKTEVHSWHTRVFLIEVPNIGFNSVHFEEYIEPKKSFTIEDMKNCWIECDKLHAERSDHGLPYHFFDRFIKEKYNIDITK